MKVIKLFKLHFFYKRRRVKTFQRNWEEQKSATENLRQRLINSCLLRRKLQTELWHCMDDLSRLSKQNEKMRKMIDNQKSNEGSKLSGETKSDNNSLAGKF